MTAISNSRNGAIQLTIRQEQKILLFWCLTVWLIVMNTTMFNVALPTILTDLSLSSTKTSWIVSGYSITFAISSLTFSRLSDYLPISRLITTGLIILVIASVLGFLAEIYSLLLFSRILQAAGAGAVPGLAMVLASKYIPLVRRGRAMALIGSAASLGFGLGPVLGGIITQFLGWNYLFAVTCLTLFLIPVFLKLLPKEKMEKGQFDIVGAGLTAFSTTLLLLFFSNLSITILILTIFSIYLWWKYLHNTKIPFIQPQLLKNYGYVKLLLIALAAFLIHFSTLFLMPLMLTDYFAKNALTVGMMIFPGAILSALSANFIGKMIDYYGNRLVLIIGQIAVLVASLIFAFYSSFSPIVILIAYCFMSPGFSALTSSVSNEVSQVLSLDNLGAGMGLLQLVQFVGGGLGVSLSGLLILLQNQLSYATIYRNVYIMLAFVIFASMIVSIIYFRKQILSTKEYDKGI